MSSLEELRARIDGLDRQLLDLLVDRLRVAVEIGRAKEAAGLSFYDPARERQVLERLVIAGAGRYPAGKLQSIYREILSAARTEQAAETILVHGVRGSLAHWAGYLRFGSSSVFEPITRADDLFARLEEESAGYAIMTLEGHSLEASMDRLDLFLQSDVSILGEVRVRPRIGLYVREESTEPKEIYATTAVLSQVARWMAERADDRIVRVCSTVDEAAELAGAGGGGLLGYPIVERLLGWVPLEEGIEDLPDLKRRFFILGRRESAASGNDRTALLIVLPNRPGALHEVTSILERHRVNLAWIEPKSTHVGAWEHLFLLELDGHRAEERVAKTIEELNATAPMLRVLGSYPAERV